MADIDVDDIPNTQSRNQIPPIVEKFGNITIVTASVSLLFQFLIRNLKYLSYKKGDAYTDIVKWAITTLEKIVKIRNELRSNLEDITFDHQNSRSAFLLGCKKNITENGDIYSYSYWYNSRYRVSEEIEKENTLTLADAQSYHLLDQICYRIKVVLAKMKMYSNCDFDFVVCEFFENKLDELKKFRDQACDLMEQLDNALSRMVTPTKPERGKVPLTPQKKNKHPPRRQNLVPKKLNFNESNPRPSYADIVKTNTNENVYADLDTTITSELIEKKDTEDEENGTRNIEYKSLSDKDTNVTKTPDTEEQEISDSKDDSSHVEEMVDAKSHTKEISKIDENISGEVLKPIIQFSNGQNADTNISEKVIVKTDSLVKANVLKLIDGKLVFDTVLIDSDSLAKIRNIGNI